ncbi:dihydropteroate synthase [Mesosutterella sp. OilRF-GAM-744-9]|uniref:Dihydropteroate synthase n=1 Tax=Mesosutterella porci TaxID=2915351 RepID=A0ABS9MSL5_9BURK|nr:dihydropteroate synthase [Mesosutterella sp. oilRF-744-WT-GAM-9]MCG5031599.1 dihydropteroate synthase [Mesosutterella sp. oilRF-744-WT-GAM-9]MCI6530023.1 dihydropteroate synthase [Mesosutterella sp.]
MPVVRHWQCGSRNFSLDQPLVMGILNVTPDSFSDGGEHNSFQSAVAWGRMMVAQGADIVDVGGESTRPNAEPVSEQEELDRVIPVVEALSRQGCTVSVDTSRASVMLESVKAGACILNDVRAFTEPGALDAAASTDAGLIIMHGWKAAEEDRRQAGEGSLIESIIGYLKARQTLLESKGVDPARICWDPGFGFGKTVRQNFEILAATSRFVKEGQPFLMALSRKSSLGAVTGVEVPARRVAASVAGALIAIERGAQLVRVHDVAETIQAIKVLQAVRSSSDNKQ